MRTVHALGEVHLIDRLRRRLGRAPSSLVEVGIGDDAAVLKMPGRRRLLFASDMIVENVHFRLPAAPSRIGSRAAQAGRRTTPAQWIGWKALAANVSDIAAMGGEPLCAVVSLGLPPSTPTAFVDALYGGLARCARRFGVAVVGGDTVRAARVTVDVAMLGTVERRHLVLRSGAQVGDTLFVTGRLGGSLASGRHARFTPRVREAQQLVRQVRIHAMMDLSDGLASDLWQMSRASRVVLRVEAARIPVSRAARTLQRALSDGEDFELLFAVGWRDVGRVPRRIGSCPITRIGAAVRRGVRVELQQSNGRISPLAPAGFRHF